MAKEVRDVRVAEDPGLLLGEDAVARERAQDALQSLGIGADLPRDILDGA
jgi:hypothetical protein